MALAATADDSDGTVLEVEFLVDGEHRRRRYIGTLRDDLIADAVGFRTIAARARDDDGALTTSAPISFEVTPPVGPVVVASDDFNRDRTDSAIWTFDSPLGNGRAYTSDGHMVIEVPAGQEHDLWQGVNTIVSMVQAAPDTDMAVEARFESIPTVTTQIQGFVVQSSANEFTRFDVHTNSNGDLVAFAGSVDFGVATSHGSVTINETGFDAIWLRLTRSGSTWTGAYSVDGTVWTTAATFSRSRTVEGIGLFGGNAGLAPAFDVIVDSFEDMADPLVAEDGGPRVVVVPPAMGAVFASGPNVDLIADFVGTRAETNSLATLELYVDDTLFGSSPTDSVAVPWTPDVGTYRVIGRAEDLFGATTTSAPRTIAVHAPGDAPAAFSSDFRERALDPVERTLVDPTGVGTTSLGGGELSLGAPSGLDTATDATSAPRWTQALAGTDFGFELALGSLPANAGESAGPVFTNGGGDALRIGFATKRASCSYPVTFTGGGSSSLSMSPCPPVRRGSARRRLAGLLTVRYTDAGGTLLPRRDS